jgi:hypothetical protein
MRPWEQDSNDVVVVSVNAELKALKKGKTVATQWVEGVLFDSPKECLWNVCNLDGDPIMEIKFKTVADG